MLYNGSDSLSVFHIPESYRNRNFVDLRLGCQVSHNISNLRIVQHILRSSLIFHRPNKATVTMYLFRVDNELLYYVLDMKRGLKPLTTFDQ